MEERVIYEHVVNRSQPVRAVLWTGINWDEILRFVGLPVADKRNTKPSPGWTKHGYFEIAIEDSTYLMVPTPFGRLSVQKGTWVVENALGYCPVDPSLFEADYVYGESLAQEIEEGSAVWDDGYSEGCRDMEEAVPPFLRRFFWWDKRTLTHPWKPFYKGGDEYCNDTIGIRLKGGVLFIRTGRTIRLEPNPDCPKCGGCAHE